MDTALTSDAARSLVYLLLALVCGLVACSEKRPAKPSAQITLPLNCIIGAVVDSGKCKQVGVSDVAVCDGIVVKYACVKVKP